eukprot:COSAG02_NODE_22807_length_739_cov_1.606250_1_plen_146_part_01
MVAFGVLVLVLLLSACSDLSIASDHPVLVSGSGSSSARSVNGIVRIEPWGANALRVRIALGSDPVRQDLPGALIRPGSDNKGAPLAADMGATAVRVRARSIRNGNIEAVLSPAGLVTVRRVSDSTVLLRESARGAALPVTTTHGNV